MQRTPSGKGWTRLYIQGTYAYDTQAVREKLLAYLANATASPAPLPESSQDHFAEKQATALEIC